MTGTKAIEAACPFSPELEILFRQIDALRESDGRQIFRDFDSRRFYAVQAARLHAEALFMALTRLVSQWTTVRNPSAYALRIAEVESGNFCERDFLRQAAENQRAADAALRSPAFAELVSSIGGSSGEARKPAPDPTPRPDPPPDFAGAGTRRPDPPSDFAGAGARRPEPPPVPEDRREHYALGQAILSAAEKFDVLGEIRAEIVPALKMFDRRRIQTGRATLKNSMGFRNALLQSDFGFLGNTAAGAAFRAEVAALRGSRG